MAALLDGPKVTPEDKLIRQAAVRKDAGETAPKISANMGIGRSTVYKNLKIAHDAEIVH